MRLVTYMSGEGEPGAGVQAEGGVIDAAVALGRERVSVR